MDLFFYGMGSTEGLVDKMDAGKAVCEESEGGVTE